MSCTKKSEIWTYCRVSEAKFYLYHSTKIAKTRPGFDEQPEHPSVQINSSSPWPIGPPKHLLSDTKSKTDQSGFFDAPKRYAHSDGTENDEK